uniref:Small ribosomal subunit protein mS26 n=1 Tax=Angiostrongylus cantonensis TaxID=6313 RepID=A0A0K0D939_ANGCA
MGFNSWLDAGSLNILSRLHDRCSFMCFLTTIKELRKTSTESSETAHSTTVKEKISSLMLASNISLMNVNYKVLYNVVHVPWQSPEDVKELLWRRHVYNNAVISLKEVFRQEIREAEAAGKSMEAMKEEEDAEFNRLIAENDVINQKKAEARAKREEAEWRTTQQEILKEIDEALQKQHKLANEASAEVRAAIDRSQNFVDERNLEEKILEALENPKVYDFAIDQGIPTRQKGRFFDRTLGVSQANDVKKEDEQDILKASRA